MLKLKNMVRENPTYPLAKIAMSQANNNSTGYAATS